MKLNYTNILLFSLSLNILSLSPKVYNQRNHKRNTTSRILCECELYAPANYDNDPEMKAVMQDFDHQTSQRFEEYNERMIKNRQKCKEQCEKDIQKIILKDKIEKELAVKFVTLETNIDTNDIPTCVCEKSLADKMEKTCLRCGGILGGIAPSWGLVSGIGYALWTNYAATTLVKIATDAGIAEGVKVGLVKVTEIVSKLLLTVPESKVPAMNVLQKITAGKFTDEVTLYGIFRTIDINACGQFDKGPHALFSTFVQSLSTNPKIITNTYPTEAEVVSTTFSKTKAGVLAEGASRTSSLTTAITASIITIVIIVLVMLVIYLILRYRRKKKMKKKLQYMKLLKE
ncbi:rifin [Plasmodium sp. gorilla clade G1]|nr:rifin [Plasmodium sp. gorilla clade G1]